MEPSIFDSQSERRLFRRLNSSWKGWIEVYPQIPVRKVLGYQRLLDLPITDRARDYLLKTEFDFVICKGGSADPVLAVEFDGIGHGFSKDGEYVSRVVPINDSHRSLKLNAKLEACDLAGFPLVVLSFEETKTLPDSDGMLTVLDAVIGEVLSSRLAGSRVQSRMAELSAALESDPSGETTEDMIWGIEIEADFEANPIRRRTAELRQQIGHSGYAVTWLRDRPGYVGARYSINGGVIVEAGKSKRQELMSVSVYIREVSCAGAQTASLLESIGEYCLYRKAVREVGSDRAAWAKLAVETPWTED